MSDLHGNSSPPDLRVPITPHSRSRKDIGAFLTNSLRCRTKPTNRGQLRNNALFMLSFEAVLETRTVALLGKQFIDLLRSWSHRRGLNPYFLRGRQVFYQLNYYDMCAHKTRRKLRAGADKSRFLSPDCREI